MKPWRRVVKQLPPEWEKTASSPKTNLSGRAIAAFLYAQRCHEDNGRDLVECEGEARAAFPNKKGEPVSPTAYERAGMLVNSGSGETIRRAFDGIEGYSIYTLYEKGGSKYPKPSPSPVTPRTDLEILSEFVKLFDVDNLAKAWKAQAAAYNTDRPGTGDAVKGTRLNELWAEVKKILTPVVPVPVEPPAQTPASAAARAAVGAQQSE